MSMTWLRWHHGTICDPRFTVIARKSGQSRALVLAVWSGILECGSQADERGNLDDFEADTLAAYLDVEEEAVTAIYQAMQDKQLIHDGRIANWDRSQSYRGTTSYTSTSSERVRRFRERQKFIAGEIQIAATPEIPEVITPDQIHTPVTGYEYVTPGNEPALVTHETVVTPDTDTDQKRTEKRKRGKEEKSIRCWRNGAPAQAQGGIAYGLRHLGCGTGMGLQKSLWRLGAASRILQRQSHS